MKKTEVIYYLIKIYLTKDKTQTTNFLTKNLLIQTNLKTTKYFYFHVDTLTKKHLKITLLISLFLVICLLKMLIIQNNLVKIKCNLQVLKHTY